MKPWIVLVLFASFLTTTMTAQTGTTPAFPPDIKIVGVFPMPSMHSQITYKGTGAFHRSNMQQSTDYTRAESGVVPGSETAHGAIIPPAGGTFPDSKTAQNHMSIYEPNKTGSGEIDTKSASTADLVRGRIIMQGLSADPAKAKEQMQKMGNFLCATGACPAIVIQNVGTREIKAIEWKYPYRYDSRNKTKAGGNKLRWHKYKVMATIPPQEIVPLSAQNHRANGTSKRIDQLDAMQITRIIYTSGPDWKVK